MFKFISLSFYVVGYWLINLSYNRKNPIVNYFHNTLLHYLTVSTVNVEAKCYVNVSIAFCLFKYQMSTQIAWIEYSNRFLNL